MADELYSGIANGSVLTEELCTRKNQMLILHLFTNLLCKDICPLFSAVYSI